MNAAPSSPLPALNVDETELLALVDDVWKHQSSLKPKKTRRRDRNRPWHEIARLQTQAEELERELETQLAQASTSAVNSFATYLNNAELKALIRESIQDTGALEWNLNRQMQELVQMLPPSVAMKPTNLPFVANQDSEVFWELARCVDEQYNGMEQVLRLAGLDESISEVEDAFFLVVGGHVCSMRTVVKQFKHNNRDVMVWTVLGDWTLVGDMPNRQTHEQGWGFIQPVNANTSVCLNYSRVNSPLAAPEQCEFLAKLYQDMIISRLHMIESHTLDRAVQKKNRA
eukprot:jgi/Phyca11/10983/fgenesh1_pm.PHYCAscaffold_59_\